MGILMYCAQVHNELAGVSPSCGWILLTLDIQLSMQLNLDAMDMEHIYGESYLVFF
jgi:hypothetical protein